MTTDFVDKFKRYLKEDGKSPKTIESYVGDIAGFVSYIQNMGVRFQGELKRFYVTSFRNYLIESQYETATINKKINSIQSFNSFLMKNNYTSEFVVDLRKDRMKVAFGSEKQVEVFSEKQVERMLFYMQNEDKVSRRDRMILFLLLYTGVRVSELCDIRVRNIDFLTSHLKVYGKGGNIREVPLKPEVVESIKEYLAERIGSQFSDSEYLILGQRGALKRDAINTLLEKYTKELELGINLKPHTFRHTLLNGMFDLDKFQLLYHQQEFYSAIQIPIVFNRNAQYPSFIRFLHQVFEGDIQRIALAQEWVGYLISSETKAQKALILYGTGANGKGVFVDTISALIGDDNISNIPLNELHKGFSRVCLYNKSANISSENETDGKGFNTQYFKSIVGEGMIHAEQKNKPVFSFKPTAKIVMAMNNLPYTKDKSQGYYRRLSILHFSAFFKEEQRDKDLKQKLQAELPGIFLWALEGLKRLRKNNYNFSECDSTKKILNQYEKELNPIMEFCEECIESVEDEAFREDNRVIYNSLRQWAISSGLRSYSNISSQRFWREFEACTRSMGYKCEKGKSNALRYHTGIRVLGEYRMEKRNFVDIFEKEL
jgi:putative DNA primase/helicase